MSRVIELHRIESEPNQVAEIESEDYYDGWQSGMAGFAGRIIGQESSRVQLSVGIGGTVHGHFRYDDTYIQIGEYGQNGHHLIWSRDPPYKRKRHPGEKQCR